MISEELKKKIDKLRNEVDDYFYKNEITTLEDGMLKIFDLEHRRKWETILEEVVGIKCIPFAIWWTGEIYAALPEGTMLISPETQDAPIAKESFDRIIENHILSNSRGEIFAEEEYGLYQEWINLNGIESFNQDTVVGYNIPLILGGEETLENRKSIDSKVYFSLTWQIVDQIY